MKKRLIILSDLWGKGKSDWLKFYTDPLQNEFEIIYYDSCELAGVDTSDYNQESLHQQFVSGGIEKAVNKLMQLEQDDFSILAFSIGGTIGWNYAMRVNSIKSLICVSSTRLRYEVEKPEVGELILYFGELDPFKPGNKWVEDMEIKLEIISEADHQFYTNKEFARELTKQLLKREVS